MFRGAVFEQRMARVPPIRLAVELFSGFPYHGRVVLLTDVVHARKLRTARIDAHSSKQNKFIMRVMFLTAVICTDC